MTENQKLKCLQKSSESELSVRPVTNLHSCWGWGSSNVRDSHLELCDRLAQGESELSIHVSVCACACVCVRALEAAFVFTSVLGHLAVILLDDTLAKTHREDHPEELQEKQSSSSSVMSVTGEWTSSNYVQTVVSNSQLNHDVKVFTNWWWLRASQLN